MIKSFRQYLIEATDTKSGNYVQTKTQFPDFIDQMDVATGSKSKDPHITLVYSKEQSVDAKKLLKTLHQTFKDYGIAEIIGADQFGKEEDKACIVIKLKSSALKKINTALCSFGDIKHSYPEFSPHLTLFYDVNQEEAAYWVDWLNQRVKGHMLEFKGFESTTIIEDWNK